MVLEDSEEVVFLVEVEEMLGWDVVYILSGPELAEVKLLGLGHGEREFLYDCCKPLVPVLSVKQVGNYAQDVGLLDLCVLETFDSFLFDGHKSLEKHLVY